ncbi:hypothetical protein FACS1894130_10370 [Spirochaetia bacterium]|nr:hypothetical protein FACS1894130_10370 [Spirochaetia bacterium]
MINVMKIKIIYSILFLFCLQTINADNIDDELMLFRQLEPKEQIEKIFNDYGYTIEPGFGSPSPLRLEMFKTILKENEKAVKPLLISYLKLFDPPSDNFPRDNRFLLIDSIITTRFQDSFNRSEKRQIAEIYQEKIDYYLKKYKKIDSWLVYLELGVKHFSPRYIFELKDGYREKLLQKYSELGYTDLGLELEI